MHEAVKSVEAVLDELGQSPAIRLQEILADLIFAELSSIRYTKPSDIAVQITSGNAGPAVFGACTFVRKRLNLELQGWDFTSCDPRSASAITAITLRTWKRPARDCRSSFPTSHRQHELTDHVLSTSTRLRSLA